MNIESNNKIIKDVESKNITTKNEMINKDLDKIIDFMETKNKRNKLTIEFLQKLLEESNEYFYKIIKNFDNSNI